MTQRDITCPQCHQINRRSDRDMSRNDFQTQPMVPSEDVFNPQLCTLCCTHLKTGQRSVWALPLAGIMWATIYTMHALVIGLVWALPVVIVWLTIARFDWMYFPTVGATLLGMAIGIWQAEKSRRRGELINKRGQQFW